MTLVERIINTQRESFKKAHNKRFRIGEYEFRLIYNGGLTEFFQVLYRRDGNRNFKYIDGFSAYKLADDKAVIEYAKDLAEGMYIKKLEKLL